MIKPFLKKKTFLDTIYSKRRYRLVFNFIRNMFENARKECRLESGTYPMGDCYAERCGQLSRLLLDPAAC